MSHLRADMKMGFYPAPPVAIELFVRHLRAPIDKPASIFEPCAGEGMAVAQIASALGIGLEEVGGEDYSQFQPTEHSRIEKLEVCPSTPLRKVWRCRAGRQHETPVGDERTARLAGEVWGAFEARAGLGEIAIKIGRPEGEVRKIARVMEAYEIARTY